MKLAKNNLTVIEVTDDWSIYCEIALGWMLVDPMNSIAPGNDLVPSDDKPLSEPMLTQIDVTI